MNKSVIGLFALHLLVGNVSAQIYQWVDENGVTHYSDKPLDSESKQVIIKGSRVDSKPVTKNGACESTGLSDAAGCQSQPALIGQWQGMHGRFVVTLEVFPGGRCVGREQKPGDKPLDTAEGTWSLNQDGTFAVDFGDTLFEIELTMATELIMRDVETGDQVILTRI